MGKPFLCRVGFHKWQDYGKKVDVFWQEPAPLNLGIQGTKYAGRRGTPAALPGDPSTGTNYEMRSKVVYEGRWCTRCGMKLRRKFATDLEGRLTCAGWEPDAEETDKE